MKSTKFYKSLLVIMLIPYMVFFAACSGLDSSSVKGNPVEDNSAYIAELEREAAELQAQLDDYLAQLAVLEYSEQYYRGALYDTIKQVEQMMRAAELQSANLEYLQQYYRDLIDDLLNQIEQLKCFATMPVSFAVDSWALISVLSKNGLASEYYNIGDEKDIVLKTGEVITVQILGFDHDIVYLGDEEMLFDDEGNELGWSSMPPKMAGITLGMKDLLTTSYKMESTNTNANGWMGSLMRNDTMQTLFTQLPTDLQAVIQPVLKTTSVGGAQSGILDMAYDSLWLFSEEEIYGQTVFGTNGISNTVNGDKSGNGEEGKQYEYWQQKNGALYNTADSTNRIKKLANGTGAPSIWWLRSPYALIASNFCIVSDTGFATNAVPNTARGICFGFAV